MRLISLQRCTAIELFTTIIGHLDNRHSLCTEISHIIISPTVSSQLIIIKVAI